MANQQVGYGPVTEFHVFLSHNRQDKPLARELARRLVRLRFPHLVGRRATDSRGKLAAVTRTGSASGREEKRGGRFLLEGAVLLIGPEAFASEV